MSKTFSKQIDKIFNVSFSSICFVLSRFWVFLSGGSSKTLQTTFSQKLVSKTKKSPCRRRLQKPKSTKKQILCTLLSGFFWLCHVLGRLSRRGEFENTSHQLKKMPWGIFDITKKGQTNNPKK
jgi:hypothetical protein